MYCLIKHIWPYYILEHVVVSDWMAVACEHHRAKRKLQFEKSQQLPLCEYDLGDSGTERRNVAIEPIIVCDGFRQHQLENL